MVETSRCVGFAGGADSADRPLGFAAKIDQRRHDEPTGERLILPEAASLLGAVVMPLSTSYAICEAFGWESGISKNFREAPVFMSLITLLLVLGAIVVLIPGISLIPLIISAQIANGVLLPIILIFILRLATDRRVMGDAVNGRMTTVLGWGVAALAGSLSIAYLFVSVFAT